MRPPQTVSSHDDFAAPLESERPASFFDDPNADIWEEEKIPFVFTKVSHPAIGGWTSEARIVVADGAKKKGL